MQGDLNILQILWHSGVVVKLVLVILIACSVMSWAIIIQKKKQFKIVEEENLNFLNFFHTSTNLVEINTEAENNKESSVSAMFKAGFTELKK